jgi:hypothetical protein
MYCVHTLMLRTAFAVLRRYQCDTAQTLRARISGISVQVEAGRIRIPPECGGCANGSTRLAPVAQKGAFVVMLNRGNRRAPAGFHAAPVARRAFAGSFTPRIAPLVPDGLRLDL